MIRLFSYGDESGSAEFNNGEITHVIYFTVSEFDEFAQAITF